MNRMSSWEIQTRSDRQGLWEGWAVSGAGAAGSCVYVKCPHFVCRGFGIHLDVLRYGAKTGFIPRPVGFGPHPNTLHSDLSLFQMLKIGVEWVRVRPFPFSTVA